jgi:MATE family multidrug resistance protein
MSSTVIAAQHICITIISIFHIIPISLSMAFSVLVGNMIGAKRIVDAKGYVYIGLSTGAIWGLLSSLILTLFR